jgi:hypothetical protein
MIFMANNLPQSLPNHIHYQRLAHPIINISHITIISLIRNPVAGQVEDVARESSLYHSRPASHYIQSEHSFTQLPLQRYSNASHSH